MSDLEPITQEKTAWANGDIEPVTRKEQYLNRLTGKEQTIPDEPITRTEQYLARLCGVETDIPSSPITREEAYLAYLNGENVTLPEPITRLEQFMAFAADKSETKPTPLTREEFYWDKYQGGAFLKDFPGLPSSIVTVTDALAMPLNSLKVAITPVQSGSGDPSPDNIRPISGWTECNVTRCGVNLFDINKVYPNFKVDDRTIMVDGSGYNVDIYGGFKGQAHDIPFSLSIKCPMLSAGSYILSYAEGNDGILPMKINSDETASAIAISDGKFTIEESTRITLKRKANTSQTFTNIMLVKTDEAPSEYIPYTGQDYHITFPSEAGIVYGGTLDVVNGTLTVTHKCVDLGEYTWTKTTNAISYVGFYAVISDKMWKTESTVISSRYKATNKIRTQLNDNEIGVFNTNTSGAFRQVIVRDDTFASYTPEQVGEALNGVQYYYELASNEKVSYQLTPTEVQMLLGTNNIWADTGDILEGKYWGKKSSETRAMLNTLRDAGDITRIAPEEPEEPEEEEPEENADER